MHTCIPHVYGMCIACTQVQSAIERAAAERARAEALAAAHAAAHAHGREWVHAAAAELSLATAGLPAAAAAAGGGGGGGSARPAPAPPPRAMSTGVGALVDVWLSAARPRLVVWDFDRTVLRTHAFGEKVKVGQVARRWRDDVCDLQLFTAFVAEARRRGIGVGIASYGRQPVIAEYMRHMLAPSTSTFTPSNIVTPSAFGYDDGTALPEGKPQMLSLLCQVMCMACSNVHPMHACTRASG